MNRVASAALGNNKIYYRLAALGTYIQHIDCEKIKIQLNIIICRSNKIIFKTINN